MTSQNEGSMKKNIGKGRSYFLRCLFLLERMRGRTGSQMRERGNMPTPTTHDSNRKPETKLKKERRTAQQHTTEKGRHLQRLFHLCCYVWIMENIMPECQGNVRAKKANRVENINKVVKAIWTHRAIVTTMKVAYA